MGFTNNGGKNKSKMGLDKWNTGRQRPKLLETRAKDSTGHAVKSSRNVTAKMSLCLSLLRRLWCDTELDVGSSSH